MIEKLKLTFADGGNILGYYMVPVYWTKHIGRQNIHDVFSQLSTEFDPRLLSKIREVKKKGEFDVMQEHFILRRVDDGNYTIEDRNDPPLTYLNDQVVNQRPKLLRNGDVIAIPLVKSSGDYSCFIQVKINSVESNAPPMKQLIQCKTTKNYFLAYWEEDPDSRYHFSTNIEKVKDPGIVSSSKGYKNLRMAAEVPCPYCGNLHLIFCPECNTFICYDGVAEKVKCPSCRKKYKLKNMKGNIDIQTF